MPVTLLFSLLGVSCSPSNYNKFTSYMEPSLIIPLCYPFYFQGCLGNAFFFFSPITVLTSLILLLHLNHSSYPLPQLWVSRGGD